MIDPAIWTETGESWRLGIVVGRHTLTIHLGRRLLRIRWTGPWSR